MLLLTHCDIFLERGEEDNLSEPWGSVAPSMERLSLMIEMNNRGSLVSLDYPSRRNSTVAIDSKRRGSECKDLLKTALESKHNCASNVQPSCKNVNGMSYF